MIIAKHPHPLTRIYSLLVSLVLGVSSVGCAANECVYEQKENQKQLYAANPAISVQQWLESSNEVKGVLANGNLFSVKHWSCEHYGKQALMVLGPHMDTAANQLNASVLQLAKLALDEHELKLLSQSLQNSKLHLADAPLQHNIVSNEFDEFYVKIAITDSLIIIEIKLYHS